MRSTRASTIGTTSCVCVPSGLHAEVGVSAARAGKHLVVEKPIDEPGHRRRCERELGAELAQGLGLARQPPHHPQLRQCQLGRMPDLGLKRLAQGDRVEVSAEQSDPRVFGISCRHGNIIRIANDGRI